MQNRSKRYGINSCNGSRTFVNILIFRQKIFFESEGSYICTPKSSGIYVGIDYFIGNSLAGT
jgi:hypothetical protein